VTRLPAVKGQEPVGTRVAGRDDNLQGLKVHVPAERGRVVDRFQVQRVLAVADPMCGARIVKPRAAQAQKHFHNSLYSARV
jgi:hypothetical protein